MNTRFAGRKFVVALFVCFAVILLCASMAQAQSSGTGAISGTVTDPQGRAVPNATVTATNAGTNQARSTTTGTDGVYKISLLPPATYRVKFTAAGFKTSEVSGVTVDVTETPIVSQALEVGAVTQTVTVESSVETLQTESSTLGTTVTGNAISALPLANRNYTQILSLTAGANVGVDNATSFGKGTQDMSVNGNDPAQNNFQMDGVAVNNIANSGSSNDGTIYTGIPIPSPDAIAEFKVQTSTYDASYGRNPGANVNVVTKSGTNNFHGSAFENFRNSVLNADSFFFVKTPGHSHQVLDQNQFGGTVGGPIIKDKIFFFASYQGTRSKNAVAPPGSTNGAQIAPLTDDRTKAGIGAALCQFAAPGPNALACNGSNVSAPGLAIMNLKNTSVGGGFYLPTPSENPFCHLNGVNGSGLNPKYYTCNYSVPALYTENQFVANGDWVINSKQTLAMRYFYSHNPQDLFLGQNGGNLPGTPENVIFGNHDAVLKLTSIVTNNFVNEARISFQRNVNSATVSMPPGGTPAGLGITPSNPGFGEPPTMILIFNNYTLFGGLLPDYGPTNQYQASDQVSWTHGRHSIRGGFEYEDTRWPLDDAGLHQGLLFTPDLPALVVGAPGFSFGCLFCVGGIPGETGIIHDYELPNMNGYVLDDFKVNSKLTLNIGLRWEFDGLLTDRRGRLAQVWLDRMAPNSAVAACGSPLNASCLTTSTQQYVVPSNFTKYFGPPPTGVLTAKNLNSVEGHAPYSNFGPRIGFAWQPITGGKLVVRGGAGIFYDRVGLDRVVHAFEQGSPYASTLDYGFGSPNWAQASLANPYGPPHVLNPLPSKPAIGFAARFADTTTANNLFFIAPQVNSGLNSPFDEPTIHTPLVQEYNLGIQYEFLPTWVLDIGYVGSTGINLTDYNHNHNGATLFSPCSTVGSKCGTDPYGICTGASPATAICNTSNNASFRTPFLGYEPVGLQGTDFNGMSKYNSLQATVRHQFSHGLTMQGAYTWSKDLSDLFISNSANINDALNMRAQYGRVSFNRDQRFVVNYSYDLPFGKGTSGVTEKLIGGWNVSGVTVIQSGDPLTFDEPAVPGFTVGAGGAFGTSTSGIFQGVSTAQFCAGKGNGDIKSPGGTLQNLNHYFTSTAFNPITCLPGVVPFGDASATKYGNSGVGIVTGPGQFNWDISLLKNTQITEGIRMQFRADFYNAFNHPGFADPGAGAFGTVGFENVTSPTYGVITNTSVNPRLIQFALHFYF